MADSCAIFELACVCAWFRARMRASASSTVDAWCRLSHNGSNIVLAMFRATSRRSCRRL